ncbi:MAG: hypothetical protein ABH854_00755 [Candidatus Diapherotrites archaeon]
MNRKGQISFEVLLLIAVVFLLSFMVAGSYFSIHDETYALAKVKTEVLGILHERGMPRTIQSVVSEVDGTAIRIDVTLSGENVAVVREVSDIPEDHTRRKMCGEIAKNTIYETVVVNINTREFCTATSPPAVI